jgi:DNA-binding GntR family transcriptional regulator
MPAARSLRHDVRNHLRNLILDGTLKPGDRIVESRLARELGISQAPIREALRELEQMGLVVNYPNRGSSVRQIDARDAEEMYTLRAHLEVMAIHLAAPRLTNDDLDALDSLIDQMVDAGDAADPDRLTELDTRFHEYICEKAEHLLLLRMWRDINPLNWTMITIIRIRDRNLHELAERHRPIVAALRAQNTILAEEEIRTHILVLGDRVVKELQQQEGEGV